MSDFQPPDQGLRANADIDLDPDAPVIIGVALSTPLRAQEFLLAMNGLRVSGALKLKDAVIVSKKDGKVNVVETIDPTPGKAAASGAMWTGLLGLIVGGPIGWLAGIGVGAGVGAVTAKVVDLGIPDEWVGWFKQAVHDGTTAVVILAEHVHVGELAAEAARFQGAELLYTTLPPESITQLSEAFASD
ncbi:MAG: putative membrane protein [Ilumatobacter sp.]